MIPRLGCYNSKLFITKSNVYESIFIFTKFLENEIKYNLARFYELLYPRQVSKYKDLSIELITLCKMSDFTIRMQAMNF